VCFLQGILLSRRVTVWELGTVEPDRKTEIVQIAPCGRFFVSVLIFVVGRPKDVYVYGCLWI